MLGKVWRRIPTTGVKNEFSGLFKFYGLSTWAFFRNILQNELVCINQVRHSRERRVGSAGHPRPSIRKEYNSFWGEESTWRVPFRCKICPDAIGDSSDLAALDTWPGGSPVGEDEGFNAAIIRTKKGYDLGLACSDRYKKLNTKKDQTESLIKFLKKQNIEPKKINKVL